MPLHFHPKSDTFDAYDHNGDPIATDEPLTDSWEADQQGRLVEPPQGFFDAVNDAYQGDQPTAYNQRLARFTTTNQMQLGTPP